MLDHQVDVSLPVTCWVIDGKVVPKSDFRGTGTQDVSAFLEKRKPNFPGRPSKDMPPYYPWWEEAQF